MFLYRSKLLRTLVLFLFCMKISSCSSNDTVDSDKVDPDAYYGSYRGYYSGEDKKVYFSAQFRVGGNTGTTVKLTSPAKISIAGNEMELVEGEERPINVSGTYYNYELDVVSSPEDSYLFSWVRNDEKVIENTVTLPGDISVSSPSSASELKEGDTLTIVYDVVDDIGSDTVECFFGRRLKSSSSGYFSPIISKFANSSELGEKKCDFSWDSYFKNWFDEDDEYNQDKYEWAVWVIRQNVTTVVNGHPEEGGKIVGGYTSARTQIVVTR
ncbi:MAG: hypothetical protein R3B45_14415 [Bdellovibrionota bacterium]